MNVPPPLRKKEKKEGQTIYLSLMSSRTESGKTRQEKIENTATLILFYKLQELFLMDLFANFDWSGEEFHISIGNTATKNDHGQLLYVSLFMLYAI